MKTAVAIRHVHFEDLGSFAAPIEAAGYKVRYLDPGIDELRPQDVEAADLLVVLGGPVGAYEGQLYPILQGRTRDGRTDARHLPGRRAHGPCPWGARRSGFGEGDRLGAG